MFGSPTMLERMAHTVLAGKYYQPFTFGTIRRVIAEPDVCAWRALHSRALLDACMDLRVGDAQLLAAMSLVCENTGRFAPPKPTAVPVPEAAHREWVPEPALRTLYKPTVEEYKHYRHLLFPYIAEADVAGATSVPSNYTDTQGE